MCLSIVTKDQGDIAQDRIFRGWKVIDTWQGNNSFWRPPTKIHLNFCFLYNAWHHDDSLSNIWAEDTKLYKTGFHFFKWQQDADEWIDPPRSNWCVVRVAGRKLTAIGLQGSYIVYVAREIYVCRPGENLPENLV